MFACTHRITVVVLERTVCALQITLFVTSGTHVHDFSSFFMYNALLVDSLGAAKANKSRKELGASSSALGNRSDPDLRTH